MTLDELIERLQKIRVQTPGDFHIHFCSEHPVLKTGGIGQLQEPVKDIAISNRQGLVILLAESFK